VVDEPAPPPNYSIRLEDGSATGRARKLNLLYQSSQLVARSRTPARVLDALFRYLASHDWAPAPGLLHTTAIAAVRDGQAVLLPRQVLYALETLQPRLDRAGLQLVHGRFSSLDASRGELVVPAAGLQVDLSALEELDGHAAGSPGPVPPGRYPVRAWAFLADAEEVPGGSRATALAAALPTLDLETWGVEAALDMLADVFERVVPFAISLSRPQDLVGRAERALSR
jgi:hypothetical protein